MRKICNRTIDEYSMLIITNYLRTINDVVNVVLVCKKFQQIPSRFKYNPVTVTNTKLFNQMEMQILHFKGDEIIEGMREYRVAYAVRMRDVNKYQPFLNHFRDIIYTKQDFENQEELMEGVTIIGKNCFEGLTQTIDIPLTTTRLQKEAFADTQFEEIIIPFSVKKIGKRCFANNKKLKVVYIQNPQVYISYDCFNNCVSLEEIYFVGDKSTQSIVSYDMSLKIEKCGVRCYNVIFTAGDMQKYGTGIPATCNELEYLVMNKGVKSVVVPERIKRIHKIVFKSSCKELESIVFQGKQLTECYWKVSYVGMKILKRIGIRCYNVEYSDRDWKFGRKLNSFQGITSVGYESFYFDPKLDLNPFSLSLPYSLTKLSGYSFHNCSKLTAITLPYSLVSIGSNSFDGCIDLVRINIPTSVSRMGENVFDNTPQLRELEIPNSVVNLGLTVIPRNNSFTKLIIPYWFDGLEWLEKQQNVQLTIQENPIAQELKGNRENKRRKCVMF